MFFTISCKKLDADVCITFNFGINTWKGQATFFTGYPLFQELVSTDTRQIADWHQSRMTAYRGSILHFMRSVYNRKIAEEGFEIQFLVKNNSEDTAIKLGNFYGALNFNKSLSFNNSLKFNNSLHF